MAQTSKVKASNVLNSRLHVFDKICSLFFQHHCLTFRVYGDLRSAIVAENLAASATDHLLGHFLGTRLQWSLWVPSLCFKSKEILSEIVGAYGSLKATRILCVNLSRHRRCIILVTTPPAPERLSRGLNPWRYFSDLILYLRQIFWPNVRQHMPMYFPPSASPFFHKNNGQCIPSSAHFYLVHLH